MEIQHAIADKKRCKNTTADHIVPHYTVRSILMKIPQREMLHFYTVLYFTVILPVLRNCCWIRRGFSGSQSWLHQGYFPWRFSDKAAMLPRKTSIVIKRSSIILAAAGKTFPVAVSFEEPELCRSYLFFFSSGTGGNKSLGDLQERLECTDLNLQCRVPTTFSTW